MRIVLILGAAAVAAGGLWWYATPENRAEAAFVAACQAVIAARAFPDPVRFGAAEVAALPATRADWMGETSPLMQDYLAGSGSAESAEAGERLRQAMARMWRDGMVRLTAAIRHDPGHGSTCTAYVGPGEGFADADPRALRINGIDAAGWRVLQLRALSR